MLWRTVGLWQDALDNAGQKGFFLLEFSVLLGDACALVVDEEKSNVFFSTSDYMVLPSDNIDGVTELPLMGLYLAAA